MNYLGRRDLHRADVVERQTRMVQDHVPERVWRFKSSHRHKINFHMMF